MSGADFARGSLHYTELLEKRASRSRRRAALALAGLAGVALWLKRDAVRAALRAWWEKKMAEAQAAADAGTGQTTMSETGAAGDRAGSGFSWFGVARWGQQRLSGEFSRSENNLLVLGAPR